jgi:hypothetical protein
MSVLGKPQHSCHGMSRFKSEHREARRQGNVYKLMTAWGVLQQLELSFPNINRAIWKRSHEEDPPGRTEPGPGEVRMGAPWGGGTRETWILGETEHTKDTRGSSPLDQTMDLAAWGRGCPESCRTMGEWTPQGLPGNVRAEVRLVDGFVRRFHFDYCPRVEIATSVGADRVSGSIV